ncbi:unnamed protein product [Paramecium primaurelia]|uniref:Protein kinase domain-containing protein n=1 Tax=Paramecium primaurelia TaxID=5886 RepID=A0A8S1N7R9_PARPR|nr:unnamed protein product [Paramecium primaurelia]
MKNLSHTFYNQNCFLQQQLLFKSKCNKLYELSKITIYTLLQISGTLLHKSEYPLQSRLSVTEINNLMWTSTFRSLQKILNILSQYRHHQNRWRWEDNIQFSFSCFSKINIKKQILILISKKKVNKFHFNQSPAKTGVQFLKEIIIKLRIKRKMRCQEYKNFETIKKLGVGKYSEVFLAIQIQTGFLVTLKMIQKALIIKEIILGQLAWEIKIQYLLDHPNISRCIPSFRLKVKFFLVLDYCSHEQLNTVQQAKQNKRFIEKDAVQLVQQIKFRHQTRQYLVEFWIGQISRLLYSKDDRQIKCGTLIYASPEILEGDKKIDIQGLGVLTYELCFGKPPWKENQQELMKTACFMIPNTASRDLRDFIENLVKRLSHGIYTAQQAYNHGQLQRSMQVILFYISSKDALFN